MIRFSGQVALLTLLVPIVLIKVCAAAGNQPENNAQPQEKCKPIRIVWTGASFVPPHSATLTAKMFNRGNSGIMVLESCKVFGSPHGLAINPETVKQGS